MSAPLVFVSTWRVKPDAGEDLERYYRRVVEIVEAHEPQIIAFHGFLSEDGSEFTSIQVHPDAASMEFHMKVLMDNWEDSFAGYADWVESVGSQYYGDRPAGARALDERLGTVVSEKPRHVAGFTRGGD